MTVDNKSLLRHQIICMSIVITVLVCINAALWIPYAVIDNKVNNQNVTKSQCLINVTQYGGKYYECSVTPHGGLPISYKCNGNLKKHNGDNVSCWLTIQPPYPGVLYPYLIERDAKCHSYDYKWGCINLAPLIVFGSIFGFLLGLFGVLCIIILMYEVCNSKTYEVMYGEQQV